MIDRKEKIKFLSRMCSVKECEKCKLFPSKCVEFGSADDQEIDDMFRTAFPVMSSNEEKENETPPSPPTTGSNIKKPVEEIKIYFNDQKAVFNEMVNKKQQDYKDLIKEAVDQIRKIQDDLFEIIFAES